MSPHIDTPARGQPRAKVPSLTQFTRPHVAPPLSPSPSPRSPPVPHPNSLGHASYPRLLQAVFRVLYWLLPRASGIWGHVVPITHVPAWAETRRGAGPTARPLLSPHERVLDPPEDCSRLRMVLSVLQVVTGMHAAQRGRGSYGCRATPGRA